VSELDAYLSELTNRLKAVHGLELVGVYVGGSYALGGYEHGRSDVDVAAVERLRTTVETKDEIVDVLRHENLPCPARGLEFVLYPLETVQVTTSDPGFDLNLNTGRDMPFRVDLRASAGGAHWFPIDRSIIGRHGVTLIGPSAVDVFAPIPRHLLLPLLVQSLRWHERGDARSDDAVLNACRALRFAIEDIWATKIAAGEWALDYVEDKTLVRAALSGRSGGSDLDHAAIKRFIAAVTRDVETIAEGDARAQP
jgi:hypothetical protein